LWIQVAGRGNTSLFIFTCASVFDILLFLAYITEPGEDKMNQAQSLRPKFREIPTPFFIESLEHDPMSSLSSTILHSDNESNTSRREPSRRKDKPECSSPTPFTTQCPRRGRPICKVGPFHGPPPHFILHTTLRRAYPHPYQCNFLRKVTHKLFK
jgi:hypothetical protein